MPSGVYKRVKPIRFSSQAIENIRQAALRDINNKGRFKKGHTINKGKFFPVSENAGYSSKHTWIINHYGNPSNCEDCGLEGKKIKGRWPSGRWNIEWSNKDHKYRRAREDYNGRCFNCHFLYDKENNLKKPR